MNDAFWSGQLYGYDSPEFEEYVKEHDNPAASNFIDEIGIGLKNAWFNLTGQTHRTDTYQYEKYLDDTKNQRLAEDLMAAGLSKYGMTGSAPSGGGYQSSQPKGLQLVASLMDLAKSSAEISNVQADTGVKNAEAAATTAGIERDDKYYELQALETESSIARNEALNGLTKEQTIQTAEETLSIIDKRTRDNESHIYEMVAKSYDNLLKLKDIGTYEERHKAEMSLKESSTYLNQAKAREASEHEKLYQDQRAEIQKEIERISSQIVSDEAQRLHLSYENMVLLKDYAYKELEYQVMQYQLSYAQEHGYNFGSSGGILGSITDVGEDVTNRFLLPILKMPFNIINQGLSLFRKGSPGGF